jgi:hypothetical protein
MARLQAIVRYEDGDIYDVYDDFREVSYIPAISSIHKITFYNEAKQHVDENFRGIPYRLMKGNHDNDCITHVGDVAQFIVYNW